MHSNSLAYDLILRFNDLPNIDFKLETIFTYSETVCQLNKPDYASQPVIKQILRIFAKMIHPSWSLHNDLCRSCRPSIWKSRIHKGEARARQEIRLSHSVGGSFVVWKREEQTGTRVPIPGPLANADESRRNSRRAHENRPPFLFLTSGSVDITCQSVGLPLWTNRFLDDILLDTASRRVTFVLTRGFVPFLLLFVERNFLSRMSRIISSIIVEYSRCCDCCVKVA